MNYKEICNCTSILESLDNIIKCFKNFICTFQKDKQNDTFNESISVKGKSNFELVKEALNGLIGRIEVDIENIQSKFLDTSVEYTEDKVNLMNSRIALLRNLIKKSQKVFYKEISAKERSSLKDLRDNLNLIINNLDKDIALYNEKYKSKTVKISKIDINI